MNQKLFNFQLRNEYYLLLKQFDEFGYLKSV